MRSWRHGRDASQRTDPIRTLEQVRAFLGGSEPVDFALDYRDSAHLFGRRSPGASGGGGTRLRATGTGTEAASSGDELGFESRGTGPRCGVWRSGSRAVVPPLFQRRGSSGTGGAAVEILGPPAAGEVDGGTRRVPALAGGR